MSDAKQIVCPSCGAINRVRADKPAGEANCGKCHVSLFHGLPVDLSEAVFTRFLKKNDIPVLVDFWAEWCGPCKMMAPEFTKAAGQLEPEVRLAKLDTDAAQTVAGSYNIRGIPTMILFQNGEEIGRHSGAMSSSQIVQWVQRNL